MSRAHGKAARRWVTRSLAALALLSLSGCTYFIVGGAAAFLGVQAANDSSSSGVVVLLAEDADLFVARGPLDAGDSTEGRGFEVVAGQFRLTPTAATRLRSLRFDATGSGDDGAIPEVRLHRDANGDGLLDAGDPQLGTTSTVAGDEGSVLFDGLSLDLDSGLPVDLLVVLTMPTNAADQDSFALGLIEASAVSATTVVDSGEERSVPVFGFPVLGGTKTISTVGTLSVRAGPASPVSGAVFPNGQDAGLLQLDLRASSAESIRITRLTLQTAGSGDDLADLTRAELYLDADSDGRLDLSVDTPIVLNALPAADDGALVFDALAQTLPPAGIVRWLVVYDLAGNAEDGETFRVDLNAGSDLVANGLTSGEVIVPSGAPVSEGATLTVTRASLDVSLGPFNGDRSASPGTTLVPVLQLELAAGSAEAVVVTRLGIQGSGGGDEAADLAGVFLIVDADGDGQVDGGEPVLRGPLLFPADDGLLILDGFTRELAAGQQESWLVAYDLAASASGTDAFRAASSGAGDVAVEGRDSGLPVVASASTAGGGLLQVRGSLTLSAGPNPPPAQTPLANAVDVPVLQARIAAGAGEDVDLVSVVLRPQGSGDEQAAIASVQLYQDLNGSGTLEVGEPLLSSGTFAGDDQPLTLSDPNLATVPEGGSLDLLVCYDLNGNALHDQTFRAELVAADLVATGALSAVAIPAAGTLVGGNPLTAQRGQLTLAPGAQSPVGADVLSMDSGVVIQQVTLSSGAGEDVDVTSLRFAAGGTLSPQTGVTLVRLVRDDDRDGQLDPGDTLLGTAAAFGAGGTVTFPLALGDLLVTPAGVDVLLVLDLGGSAMGGQTVSTAVDQVAAAGQASGLVVAPQGFPLASALQTVVAVGTLTLATGPLNPGPRVVYAGQSVAAAQLTFSATGEPVRVNSLVVRGGAGNSGDDATGIAQVSLYVDDNQNGVLDLDTLLATGTFSSDPGVATFSAAPGGLFSVNPGSPAAILVVFQFSAAPTASQTFDLAPLGSGDLSATGTVSGGVVAPSGSASGGPELRFGVPGTLTIGVGPSPPPAMQTAFMGMRLAVQQIALSATNENLRLDSYRVRGAATGTGADDLGLDLVSLYLDENADGVQDASDTFLRSGTFSGDPGVLDLVGGPGGLLRIPPGPPVHLLVVYTLSPLAMPGETFSPDTLLPGDLTVIGEDSGLPATLVGTAGGGATLTTGAVGTLLIADGPAPPGSAIVNGQELRAVQQVRLSASGENVRLESYRVQGLGSGDDADLVEVALYLDRNGNGVLDADLLLVAGAYPADPGDLTFAPSGGLLSIAPGAPRDLLVVYRFGTGASTGDIFQTAGLLPGDLTLRGELSGAAIIPTGGAMAGPAFTYGSAADATRSSVAAAPGTLTADGTSTSTITVTVRDALMNPLPGAQVMLSVSGAGALLTQPGALTDAAGQATGTLAATLAETKTVTATINPGVGSVVIAQQASVSFQPGPVDAATSSVTLVPAAGVVADGVATCAVELVLRDAQGNPVPGATPLFSASGGMNSLVQPGASDPGGRATGFLRSTQAETKMVIASVMSTVLLQQPSVSFVPGAVSAGHSTVGVAPASLTADGTAAATVSITVRDALGNPVAGVPVQLVVSGSGNVIGPPGITDALGQTQGTVRSTVAETKTITTIVDPGLNQIVLSMQPLVSFVPGPVDLGASSLALAPPAIPADGVATSTVTLTLVDAQGNPVPGVTMVAINASGSGNTLVQPGMPTDALGRTTGTVSSTVAELKTVSATVGGMPLAMTATLDAQVPAGVVSSALSAVSLTPGPIVADGLTATTITITVRDAGSQPLAGQMVSIAASGAGNIVTPASGTTDALGRVTSTLASTVAETKTVVVTVNAGPSQVVLSAQPSIAFVPGPVDAGTSNVTVSPATVVADGVATTTVTVTTRDAQGNPVPGLLLSLSSSGMLNSFSQAMPTGDANGVASVTLSSTRAEAKTISAVADLGGLNLLLTQQPVVSFVPGPPSAGVSSLSVVPGPFVADGMTTAGVTITVEDAQGNPISMATVSLGASGGGNTIPPPGPTDSMGQTLTTIASSVAETKTLVATVNPGPSQVVLSTQPTVVFAPGAIDAGTSGVAVSPGPFVADGSPAANITVTLRDAQGNPIPGVDVDLNGTTGGNNVFAPASPTTDPAGSVVVSLASTTAETKQVLAVGDPSGAAVLIVQQPLAVFGPGAPSAGMSTVLTSGPTPADGVAASSVTVTVLDLQGNPVPGASVSLAASGSGNVIGPPPLTDAMGRTTGTLASTVAEAKTVTATVNPGPAQVVITQQPTASFVPGAPDDANSSVSVTPATVLADGLDTATVQVRVQDAQGNPVPGVEVDLDTSLGTANVFLPPMLTTDATGSVVASFSSTVGETKTVRARIDPSGLNLLLSQQPLVSFLPVAALTVTQNVPPVAGSIAPDERDVAFLALHLTETGMATPALVRSLSFSSAGSGNDATDLGFGLLSRDLGVIGVPDAADVPLAAVGFFVDDGTAVVAGLSELVPAGGSLDLLLTIDAADASQLTPGETYAISVPVGGIVAETGLAVPVPVSGLGLTGPVRTVSPYLDVQAGPANPARALATVAAAELDLPLVQLELTPVAGDQSVVGLTVEALDAGPNDADDSLAVAALCVYLDANDNGFIDGGDRELGRLDAPFAADDGTASVTLTAPESLPLAGGAVRWLVGYDLAGGLAADARLDARITALNVAAPNHVRGGLPVAGAQPRVAAELFLSVGPVNPGGFPVPIPCIGCDVVGLGFQVQNDATEAVTITGVTAAVSGDAPDDVVIPNVRLYLDDGDGVIELGTDDAQVGGTQAFAMDDGTVSFAFSQPLLASATQGFYLSFDVNTAPPILMNGGSIRFRIPPGGIVASGSTSGALRLRGAPALGDVFYAESPPALFGAPTTDTLDQSAASVVDLACGDLDRDGNADYVALLSNGRCELRLGDGAGAFSLGGVVPPAGNPNPMALAVGDLNRDGQLDLVAAYEAVVTVLLQSGGMFNATDVPLPGTMLQDVVLVDYDGDGDLDAVLSDAGLDQVLGLRNVGGGTLQALDGISLGGPTLIARLDDACSAAPKLAVARVGPLSVELLTGTGSFFAAADNQPLAVPLVDLLGGRIDGDRFADALAIRFDDLLTPFGGLLAALNPFAPATTSPPPLTANGPARAVLGDWNGVARPGLAIAQQGVDGIVVYLGSGTLFYDPEFASQYTPGIADPDRIASADFNGDADPDLLVASSTVAGSTRLLPADGVQPSADPTLVPPAFLPWSATPTGIASVDLNCDGELDLLALGGNLLGAWLGDEHRGFAPQPDAALSDAGVLLAVGDISGDGLEDAVVAFDAGGIDFVEVLPGDGTGGLGAPLRANLLGASTPVGELLVADLDRDGDLDAVLGEATPAGFQVLFGNGAQLLDAQAGDRELTLAVPVDLALADLEADGDLDLLVLVDGGTPRVQWFLNGGSGDFTLGGSVVLDPALGVAGALAVGDIDRDGRPDLVVGAGAGGGSSLQVLSGPPPFVDRGLRPASSNLRELALGDTDADGDLDILAGAGGGVGALRGLLLLECTNRTTFAYPAISQAELAADFVDIEARDVDDDADVDVISASTGPGTGRRGLHLHFGR